MQRDSRFTAPAVVLVLLSTVTAAVGAQPLVNGGSIDGAINSAGQMVTHSFSASGGQACELRIRDLDGSSFYPRMTVLDPQGTQLATGSGQDVAAIRLSAPITGTYRVVVADGNSTPNRTGRYRIHFVRVPGANEGGVLPNGSSVASSIEMGDLDSYTFPIVAGESFLLRFADANSTQLYPAIRVYDPRGTLVTADANSAVAAVGGAAEYSGVYTVVVADGNTNPAATGDYELHFVRAPGANEGGALPVGGVVTGRIDQGDLDSFTFAITAGESYQIRLADTNATGFYPRVILYDPRGCLVAQDSNQVVAALGGAAEFSGVYTVVVVDGNTHPAQTGDYRLHYVRAPGANAGGRLRAGGSIAARIDLGDLDSYTFDVQAGETFWLRVADTRSTPLYPRVIVYDPRGCFVGQDSNQVVASFARAATHSGTYTVVVADGNTHPAQQGEYSIFFVRAPGANAGGPLRNGGSRTGSIEVGELDTFTFAVDAGDHYAIRVADSLGTPFYPRMVVYDPRGTFVRQDSNQDVAALSGRAAFSGTYTLVVTDGNTHPAQVGDYEVHFVRSPGANEHGYLLDGVGATQVISKGDLDSYTFRARAGGNASITVVDTGNGPFYPGIWLYDPSGELVRYVADQTTVVLNSPIIRDGTYTIVVADGTTAAAASGSYSIVLNGTGYAGNSGCANEGPPVLSGAPSARTGFAVAAPSFTRTCIGPPIVVLGTCLPSPALLPPSLTCGSCGLQLAATILAAPGQVVVPPLPAALVGVPLCAQSACGTGSCLALSAAATFVIDD